MVGKLVLYYKKQKIVLQTMTKNAVSKWICVRISLKLSLLEIRNFNVIVMSFHLDRFLNRNPRDNIFSPLLSTLFVV